VYNEFRAAIGWLPRKVHTKFKPVTAGRFLFADWSLRHAVLRARNRVPIIVQFRAILGTRGEVMHGRSEKTAPTSAGSVPYVSMPIVDAAASRDRSRSAVPPPRIRGGLGQNRVLFDPPSLHCSWTWKPLTVCLCRADSR